MLYGYALKAAWFATVREVVPALLNPIWKIREAGCLTGQLSPGDLYHVSTRAAAYSTLDPCRHWSDGTVRNNWTTCAWLTSSSSSEELCTLLLQHDAEKTCCNSSCCAQSALALAPSNNRELRSSRNVCGLSTRRKSLSVSVTTRWATFDDLPWILVPVFQLTQALTSECTDHPPLFRCAG